MFSFSIFYFYVCGIIIHTIKIIINTQFVEDIMQDIFDHNSAVINNWINVWIKEFLKAF